MNSTKNWNFQNLLQNLLGKVDNTSLLFHLLQIERRNLNIVKGRSMVAFDIQNPLRRFSKYKIMSIKFKSKFDECVKKNLFESLVQRRTTV